MRVLRLVESLSLSLYRPNGTVLHCVVRCSSFGECLSVSAPILCVRGVMGEIEREREREREREKRQYERQKERER